MPRHQISLPRPRARQVCHNRSRNRKRGKETATDTLIPLRLANRPTDSLSMTSHFLRLCSPVSFLQSLLQLRLWRKSLPKWSRRRGCLSGGACTAVFHRQNRLPLARSTSPLTRPLGKCYIVYRRMLTTRFHLVPSIPILQTQTRQPRRAATMRTPAFRMRNGSRS